MLFAAILFSLLYFEPSCCSIIINLVFTNLALSFTPIFSLSHHKEYYSIITRYIPLAKLRTSLLSLTLEVEGYGEAGATHRSAALLLRARLQLLLVAAAVRQSGGGSRCSRRPASCSRHIRSRRSCSRAPTSPRYRPRLRAGRIDASSCLH